MKAFEPATEAVDEVMAWISTIVPKQQIKHTDNKQWLAFDASTKQLEDLLQAEFHEHEHESSGKSIISCDAYHVPAHLAQHIDYITPGVKGMQVEASELRKRSWGPGHHGGGYGHPGGQPPKQRPAPHMPKHGNELATCDVAITPACLRALYQFEALSPHAKVSPSNSMGIFEEGDFYVQEDLNSFFTNFTSYIPNG